LSESGAIVTVGKVVGEALYAGLKRKEDRD
jgi:hypothetical protein